MHARPRFPAIALRRLAALAALALPLSATAANPSSCDFSVLDAPMQSLMQQAGLTGAAVLVGRRDGVLYERYYGGYSATTVVPIASATKLLSAARITQLAARGSLSLDAPVSTVLPQFNGLKGQMTLRQMFSHTAGYGDDEDSPVLRTNQPSLAAAVDAPCRLPWRRWSIWMTSLRACGLASGVAASAGTANAPSAAASTVAVTRAAGARRRQAGGGWKLGIEDLGIVS